MTEPLEAISGLDTLLYDVTITDESTGAPLTTGTVAVHLVRADTTTLLHPTAAVCALTHVAAGRWTGMHASEDVTTAIAGLTIGRPFDRVLVVDGLTQGRRLARCQRVALVDAAG